MRPRRRTRLAALTALCVAAWLGWASADDAGPAPTADDVVVVDAAPAAEIAVDAGITIDAAPARAAAIDAGTAVDAGPAVDAGTTRDAGTAAATTPPGPPHGGHVKVSPPPKGPAPPSVGPPAPAHEGN